MEFYDPIPAPGPNDWLTDHQETGQTFQDFIDAPWNKVQSTHAIGNQPNIY
jgi:hypothetical protein